MMKQESRLFTNYNNFRQYLADCQQARKTLKNASRKAHWSKLLAVFPHAKLLYRRAERKKSFERFYRSICKDFELNKDEAQVFPHSRVVQSTRKTPRARTVIFDQLISLNGPPKTRSWTQKVVYLL